MTVSIIGPGWGASPIRTPACGCELRYLIGRQPGLGSLGHEEMCDRPDLGDLGADTAA